MRTDEWVVMFDIVTYISWVNLTEAPAMNADKALPQGCCISDAESLRPMLFLPIGFGSVEVGSISIYVTQHTFSGHRLTWVWLAYNRDQINLLPPYTASVAYQNTREYDNSDELYYSGFEFILIRYTIHLEVMRKINNSFWLGYRNKSDTRTTDIWGKVNNTNNKMRGIRDIPPPSPRFQDMC